MKKGFTIIEMLVVVAIIAIITAVVLINYPSSRKQLLIQRVASGLAQDIRRVQSMAVSSKMVGPAGCQMVPIGGYGISFKLSDPTKVTIFADCDPDGELKTGNRCDPDISGCSKFPEMIEEITLENDAVLSFLSSASPLSITFKPPNPIISISGGEAEAIVTINLTSDASKTKTIKVNKAGLIWLP